MPEVVTGLLEAGVGISQMPCPEQRAWGGVLKRLLLHAHGIKGSPLYPLRRPLMRLFVAYTRLAYARLARGVAREIADYQRSGYEVVGVIGVGSSPSCGVSHTLDMAQSCARTPRRCRSGFPGSVRSGSGSGRRLDHPAPTVQARRPVRHRGAAHLPGAHDRETESSR